MHATHKIKSSPNAIFYWAGTMATPLRLITGWLFFSALWRRLVLADKLSPELAGYIGEKFNNFLPNAFLIKPMIRYMVENPDLLYYNMVAFTIIEGLVGLALITGFMTRLAGIGAFLLSTGILLGAGWLGTTCLDEWQIGVFGIGTGFVLMLTGAGKWSIDQYLLNKSIIQSHHRLSWLSSGYIEKLRCGLLQNIILGVSIAGVALMLITNQHFHGGVWGTLHNPSKHPDFEISNINYNNADKALSFDLMRTGGIDTYGAFVTEIRLVNQSQKVIKKWDQQDLANLSGKEIHNHYIAEIHSGANSLVTPLGALATITLQSNNPGKGTLVIEDISGREWQARLD